MPVLFEAVTLSMAKDVLRMPFCLLCVVTCSDLRVLGLYLIFGTVGSTILQNGTSEKMAQTELVGTPPPPRSHPFRLPPIEPPSCWDGIDEVMAQGGVARNPHLSSFLFN